ncbi:MAG: hypothetical protein AAF560_26525 [Acidobacteriota bacterium]
MLPILLLTTPAFAAPLADANPGATGIDFTLKAGAAASVTLTVSGPGDFHVRKTFDGGSAPYFSLFNKAGQNLTAGLYKWSLVENPTASGDRAVAAKIEGRQQDGSFSIAEDGSLVNPNLIEGSLLKDQVFNDDLIVDGSACIGTDCANGEGFSFDTLRIKENNVRLHFQDTSSTGSFPSADWRLTVNDSSNGGAEYFAIEDDTNNRIPFRIETGAQANNLYVESDGDVGIKTANPIVDLHVVEGNTPTLRLEQDGSDGFASRSWDLGGNETNFFLRDVNNGSALVFRARAGAPENSIYIQTSGSVGFGTESPDSTLDIEDDSPDLRLTNTGSGGGGWTLAVNGNTGRLNIADLGNSNIPFKFDAGANNNLLRIGTDTAGTAAADTVAIGSTTSGDAILSVQGSIVVDGTTVHADYVFEPDYALNTIDEHIAFAMENKHLPGLPKAPEGLKGPVNLVGHQMGILEELETAHLFIGQLNDTIKQLQERIEKLEAGE